MCHDNILMTDFMCSAGAVLAKQNNKFYSEKHLLFVCPNLESKHCSLKLGGSTISV